MTFQIFCFGNKLKAPEIVQIYFCVEYFNTKVFFRMSHLIIVASNYRISYADMVQIQAETVLNFTNVKTRLLNEN